MIIRTLTIALLVFTAVTGFSQVNFTANTNEGCTPLNVVFTNTTTGADSYLWDFGDGNTSAMEHPSHQFDNPGYYDVELKAFNGGSYIGSNYMYINAKGLSGISANLSDSLCPGEEAIFRVEFVGGYNWMLLYYGDGDSTFSNYNRHTYPGTGVYNATAIAVTECGVETLMVPIYVTSSAVPFVNIGLKNLSGSTFCPGDQLTFWSQIAEQTSVHWDFDDGSSSSVKNPIYTYQTEGYRNVVCTATNMCNNTNTSALQLDIASNTPANADFGQQGFFSSCPQAVIELCASGAGVYAWDLGDGNVSSLQHFSYFYSDTGSYTISLTVTNGCGNSDTNTDTFHIQTNPLIIPTAQFDFDNAYGNVDTLEVCPGENVQFNGNSAPNGGGVMNYLWDFGDGNTSTLRSPEHTYSVVGTNTVSLIVTNSCAGSDTTTKTIVVNNNKPVNHQMDYMPDSICPGEEVVFFETKYNLVGGENLYSIWFGDGDSIDPITAMPEAGIPVYSHVYSNPGSYNFIFQATNQCGNSETITGTVVVSSTPPATQLLFVNNSTTNMFGNGSGQVNLDTAACPGDMVDFWAIGGVSVEWNFGDGTSVTDNFVQHAYSDTGIYQSFAVFTSGCGDIDTVFCPAAVGTGSLPRTWFDLDAGWPVCANVPLRFRCDYSHSSDSTKVTAFWDFGDGSYSTDITPYHSYTNGGNYLVKLIVSNGCGSDSSFRQVEISSPQISFTTSAANYTQGTPIQFTNTTTNAIVYSWNFGDGNTSAAINPIHTYSSNGVYPVTLSATALNGCTAVYTDTVRISDLVVTSEVYYASCHGQNAIDLSVSGGTPPYQYAWSGEAVIALAPQGPDISGLASGNCTVVVTDADGNTLSSSFSFPAGTNPNISVSAVNENNTVISSCGSSYVDVTLILSGGTPPYSCLWSNGGTGQTLYHTSPSTQPYHVTVTDAAGCKAIKTYNVTATPALVTEIDLGGMQPACTEVTTMSVSVVSGGNLPSCLFMWNTGQNTPSVTVLPGYYSCVVTDNDTKCRDTSFYLLSTTGGPAFDPISDSWTSAYGVNDGFLSVNNITGIPPFSVVWSTVPPQFTNTITNLAPGTYAVTITDATACMSVGLGNVFTPPADLDADIVVTNPLCSGAYNGSATALPTGGYPPYTYHWSNGSPYQSLVNRNAGTYTVTVYDSHGISVTGTATLVNPAAISVSAVVSDVSEYNGDNGLIDLTVTGGSPAYTLPGYTVSWNGPNGPVQTSSAFSLDIEELVAGQYTVVVTDGNQCSATANFTVDQPDPLYPVITVVGASTVCLGDAVTLDAGSGYDQYSWSNGSTAQITSVDSSGTYSVTVTSANSWGTASIPVVVLQPFSNEKICMVTVDLTTGKNKIIWEKNYSVGTDYFKVYKAFGASYLQIGTVPFDSMSEFVDTTSTPEVHADKYKISVVDTCGNESVLSSYHETMNLSRIGTGSPIILIWNKYIDEDGLFIPDYYNLYRGFSTTNLIKFDSLTGGLSSYNYNVLNAQANEFFLVAVSKANACIPTSSAKESGGPYSQSVSNMEDNGIDPDLVALNSMQGITVYPNPFTDFTTVVFPNSSGLKAEVRLTDLTGRNLLVNIETNGNQIVIPRGRLLKGVYLLEIQCDGLYHGKLVVE